MKSDLAILRKATGAAQDIRSFGTTSAGAGGAMVPSGDVFKAFMLAVKGNFAAFKNAMPIYTARGDTQSYPRVDDTSGTASIIAEGGTHSLDTSTPFGSASLGAYLYSSGIYTVSLELLEDAAVSPTEIIERIGATRIARLADGHIIAGTGTGQPTGLLSSATLGKTGASGQVGTLITADFLDMLAALDEGYYDPEKTTWLMSRAAYKVALGLANPASSGAPLVQIDASGTPRILGFKVGVDSNMPAMGASAKSVALVNWDYVGLRTVESSFKTIVYAERYATLGQMGFQMMARLDSKLLVPGAAVYFQHPAS